MTREDLLGDIDAGFETAEQRVLLQRLMRGVSPRERGVLMLRFTRDMTQEEIGDILGVSQMQVSRIVRGALERMRLIADNDVRTPDHAGVS